MVPQVPRKRPNCGLDELLTSVDKNYHRKQVKETDSIDLDNFVDRSALNYPLVDFQPESN